MAIKRSLSILRYLAQRQFTTIFHLCSRCSRRSRLWRIGSAGVFLWAFTASGWGVAHSPSEFFVTRALAQSWVGDRANAADLETIRERGYLIVGVKDTLRPLGFRDQTGQLQGFEIDLAHQLAEELLGDREAITLVPLSNEERLSAVYDRVDVTIAQVSINESRERLVQFSAPYWLDGTAILTPDPCYVPTQSCRDNVLNITDLAVRTIAVLHGSDAIAALRWQFPQATLVGVESYQDALDQLETGAVDAFAGSRSVAIGWTQTYPSYRVLPEYITMRSLAIVMPKGVQYDALREAVNTSIEQWRTSGWLEERITAWGMDTEDEY